jgi:hypothetical protein
MERAAVTKTTGSGGALFAVDGRSQPQVAPAARAAAIAKPHAWFRGV